MPNLWEQDHPRQFGQIQPDLPDDVWQWAISEAFPLLELQPEQLGYRSRERLTWMRWRNSLSGEKRRAIYSNRDPLPGVFFSPRLIGRFARRILVGMLRHRKDAGTPSLVTNGIFPKEAHENGRKAGLDAGPISASEPA